MIAWLSVLLLSLPGAARDVALPSAPGTPQDPVFEVRPAQLAWQELSPEVFDRRWILPEPRTVPGSDLLAEMRGLLARRFDVETADGRRYRCVGDLLAGARGLAPEARKEWYEQLERVAPNVIEDLGGRLEPLLFDQRLQSQRWKPSRAHPQDGILAADSWNMKKEKRGPWGQVKVRPLMEQAAVLLHADLATIKAVENDYRAYPDNVGADYQEIFPLDGSYFVGRDAAGRPFSTLTIRFRCDLPFPFSRYTTRLGILNRFNGEDVLYTDIYSTSKDFHWLAGRDVFLPVSDSQGKWVAFLLVRHFGFDLDGVPDRSAHRREALRSSLGNLKRNAERRYRGRSPAAGAPRNDPEILNEVRVFGRK